VDKYTLPVLGKLVKRQKEMSDVQQYMNDFPDQVSSSITNLTNSTCPIMDVRKRRCISLQKIRARWPDT
jgi:hypothetical protein